MGLDICYVKAFVWVFLCGLKMSHFQETDCHLHPSLHLLLKSRNMRGNLPFGFLFLVVSAHSPGFISTVAKTPTVFHLFYLSRDKRKSTRCSLWPCFHRESIKSDYHEHTDHKQRIRKGRRLNQYPHLKPLKAVKYMFS